MTQWCDEHWEPYRSGEANGIAASFLLMQRLLDDDRVVNATAGDAKELNSFMAAHSPICCFLGSDVLDAILEEATP